MFLLTAMPPSREPGAVPTTPIVSELAHHLVAHDEHVRVLAPNGTLDLPADVEWVRGWVTDQAAWANATSGVERVFLAGLVGESVEPLRMIANALVTAGVGRVVLLDSHGGDFEEEISEETWHWSAFDTVLRRTGTTISRLRPTAVMASIEHGGYPIPGSGTLTTAHCGDPIYEYLPDAAYAFTHERDVAEAAAVLLSQDSPAEALDISGTRVSARQLCAALSRSAGTPSTLVELTEAEAIEYWRAAGWPESTIQVMLYALPAFADASSDAALRLQGQTLERTLARAPLTFDQWASEHAAADSR